MILAQTVSAIEIPVGAEVWFTPEHPRGQGGHGVVVGKGIASVLVRVGGTPQGTRPVLGIAYDRLYAVWLRHTWPRFAVVTQPETFNHLDRRAAASPRRWFRARRRDANSTEARGEHINRASLMEVGGPNPQTEGQ